MKKQYFRQQDSASNQHYKRLYYNKKVGKHWTNVQNKSNGGIPTVHIFTGATSDGNSLIIHRVVQKSMQPQYYQLITFSIKLK